MSKISNDDEIVITYGCLKTFGEGLVIVSIEKLIVKDIYFEKFLEQITLNIPSFYDSRRVLLVEESRCYVRRERPANKVFARIALAKECYEGDVINYCRHMVCDCQRTARELLLGSVAHR